MKSFLSQDTNLHSDTMLVCASSALLVLIAPSHRDGQAELTWVTVNCESQISKI